MSFMQYHLGNEIIACLSCDVVVRIPIWLQNIPNVATGYLKGHFHQATSFYCSSSYILEQPLGFFC